jgi:hypothetical protein
MRALAEAAIGLERAAAVADGMAATAELLGESGDAAGEGVKSRLGVVPVGRQA